MYIRRKVFSVLANEEGEERLYSTTEFTNVYDYDYDFEERSFTNADQKAALKKVYDKLTDAEKKAIQKEMEAEYRANVKDSVKRLIDESKAKAEKTNNSRLILSKKEAEAIVAKQHAKMPSSPFAYWVKKANVGIDNAAGPADPKHVDGTMYKRQLEKQIAEGGEKGKAAAKELKAVEKALREQNKNLEKNVKRYQVSRVPSVESYKTAAGMEARALREKGAEMGKKALEHVKAHKLAYGLGGAGLAAAGTGAAIYAHSRKNRE